MKIYSINIKDRKMMGRKYKTAPNFLTIKADSYLARLVRRNYRAFRKAGVPDWQARSYVFDTIFHSTLACRSYGLQLNNELEGK